MPTVSWRGVFEQCAQRVLDIIEAANFAAEFIVVYDGTMAKPPAWLQRSGVRIVSTRVINGPAMARNKAAESARGQLLFFVDADVTLALDSLERVYTAFQSDDDLVALFGAYDDEPSALDTVSQFRNLLHHHTHVAHPGRASTFWTGCGAVRTAAFLDAAGFDSSDRYPSVADIELGMRITAAGGKIVFDPLISCKHTKRWTLASMIRTDIVHRARPWTQLIMSRHSLPESLSLDFYLLCLRKRGIPFAAASFALHMLYFVDSSITFGVVVVEELLRGLRRSAKGDSQAAIPSAVAAPLKTIF